MSKFLRVLICSIFGLILIVACSDSPTSVPDNIIAGGDKVQFVKYDTQESNPDQSSSNFEKLESLYGAEKLIIGENSYAKSSILFSWNIYLDDSTKDYINSGEVTLDTAFVRMRIAYHLGTTSPVYFTAHELQQDWYVTTLKRDSLQYYYSDGTPNVISSDIIYTDTTVSFQLNKDVVNQWLKFQADSNLTNTNYGIILRPENGTQGFVGFQATSYYSTDSLQTVLSIVLKKSGEFYDSMAVYPNRDLHVVESVGNVPLDSQDKIILEGGYALRGKLFFDVSALPKDVTISKATLDLSVDENNTINGDPGSDSLIAQMYFDSTRDSLTADSNSYSFMKRSGSIFSGNISWMVQKWINGTANQGIRLVLYDELSSVAKIVLYGSKETNPALRPRLTIYYPKKL